MIGEMLNSVDQESNLGYGELQIVSHTTKAN